MLNSVIRKKSRQSKSNFLNKIFFIEIWYFYSYIALISYRVYLKFMSVKINYNKNLPKKNSSNIGLFCDEKFNISGLKKYISGTEFSFVSDIIKTKDIKKNILSFDISSKRKIILVALKKNIKNSDLENLGAKFYDLFKNLKKNDYILNSDTVSNKLSHGIGCFLHGIKLKSYTFEKYKTKKNKQKISIFVTGKNKQSVKDQIKFKSIEEGTFYTRDLV